MDHNAIRSLFLGFFEQRGHRVVASSPVVPHGDPTLLFTNAGMNQFKDVFLGLEARDYTRAATSQKCIRAGGKHNDLDQVGRTPRHQTFFEMLGNFSFGDYFKADAIRFAWDFLTEVAGLPKDRLWVTVFREDDEAHALWQEIAGVPAARIVRCDEKDNFWQMGDTGPCGPCTEIHWDHRGAAGPDARFDEAHVMEIWNLVFMQYDRQASGELVALPKPSVDTGMGLERLATLLQGKTSNFETDLLRPLIDQVAALSGVAYDPGEAGTPHRVIADHIRALAFAFADGALPANDGRGYVLRRILRRAARYVRKLGVERALCYELVPTVVQMLGKAYPELPAREDHIARIVRDEEDRFNRTLDRGLAIFEGAAEEQPTTAGAVFPGDVAWKLYDTYGFPADLTRILCEERGLGFDEEGFERGHRRAVETAQQAQRFVARDLSAHGELGATEFLGYAKTRAPAKVVSFLPERGELVLDRTPFYAESGGQVGDTGVIRAADGSFRFEVEDTQKAGQVWLHLGKLVEGGEGAVTSGAAVECVVDAARRHDILKNHTSTHLLHWALHEVLGPHAQQAGSVVAPDRLRFDFTHPQAVTEDELEAMERLVNGKVRANEDVQTYERSLEEAKALGATALFGEKYGDRVRVVDIGGYSKELCGGTHVGRTGEIGLFKVTQEQAVQAGVRRVTAVSGARAVDWALDAHRTLRALARRLASPEQELIERVERVQEQARTWKKKAQEARAAAPAASSATGPAIEEIAGFTLHQGALALSVPELKALADPLKAAKEPALALLASTAGETATLIAAASKAAIARGVKANELLKALTERVGGGGGGRPDMAQAGGVPKERFAEAVELVRDMLRAKAAAAPAS